MMRAARTHPSIHPSIYMMRMHVFTDSRYSLLHLLFLLRPYRRDPAARCSQRACMMPIFGGASEIAVGDPI